MTLYAKNKKIMISADELDTKRGNIIVRSDIENKKQKLMIKLKNDERKTYFNIECGKSIVIPLVYGDGDYIIILYGNTKGDSYRELASTGVRVKDSGVNAFLSYNYFVPISGLCSEIAERIMYNCNLNEFFDVMKVATETYDFVKDNIAYDYIRAFFQKKEYLSDPDKTLKSKKGLCQDTAVVFASIMRATGTPCKVCVGTVEIGNTKINHAWNEVYIKDQWVRFDVQNDSVKGGKIYTTIYER